MMWDESRDGVVALMDGPVLEAMEPRLLLSTVDIVGGKAVYTTTTEAGTVTVTVKLTGGGSGYVSFPGDNNTGTPSLYIDLVGAKSNSTLTITVKEPKKSNAGTSFEDIVVTNGSLKSVKAPKVELEGDTGLSMAVSGKTSIVLGGLYMSYVSLTAAAPAQVSMTITGSAFRSIITAPNTIMAITAKGWSGSKVTADVFTKISLSGDVTSNGAWVSTFTALGTTVKGVSIGAIKVKGVFNANVIAVGSITSLTAFKLGGGAITADSLGKLVVSGMKGKPKKGISAISGDVLAVIDLAGEFVKPGKKVLGSAKIAGSLGAENDKDLDGNPTIEKIGTGSLTVRGDAGTISVKNLFTTLTVDGKASIKSVDLLMLQTTEPVIWVGTISLESGSVKNGKTRAAAVSAPTTYYVV